MKLDLLTNATVVEDAIRFITENVAAANGKSGADPVVTKKEKQEQLLDNNIRERKQELDNKNTINQLFEFCSINLHITINQ